ncbi:MAG: type II toxin-antitoxin system RelE/ParE family toxin [bacterium]|nr:type II toxin-antitoxin system RelE/ParE family toxin [bacterium]
MDRFEIDKSWEDKDSPVNKVFQSLPVALKKSIAKKLTFFEGLTTMNLLKSNDLEKLKGYSHVLYELKFQTNPPYRMLGTCTRNLYNPLHMFSKRSKRIPPREIKTALKRIQ